MTILLLTLAAASLTPASNAQPSSVHDRIAELCTVSNTDLEGQRLARHCRAQVRAEARRKRPSEPPRVPAVGSGEAPRVP